jgi:tetratricopeptide (TPR) repeat protein
MIAGDAVMGTRKEKAMIRRWRLEGVGAFILSLVSGSAMAAGAAAKAPAAAAPAPAAAPAAAAATPAPAPAPVKNDKKGALDDVAEQYKQARAPKKDQAGITVLSPDECKSFAKDFIKAGEKDKKEAEGLFSAGVVHDQCGLDKDAEGYYKQALGKNPKLQPAMNNLGVLLQKSGQTPAALQQFEAAIKVNPTSPQAVQAYNNRGALLFDKAKQTNNKAGYDEAIGSIRRALALDAESMAAYQLLAQIYYHTAESDRAKLKLAQLVCDEAKKIDQNYAPIYNTLGLIKLRSKDVTGALTEFRKAVSIEPGLTEAQLNVAAISLSSRNYKQAEDAFQAVLKKLPSHVEATIGMGVALRGQRKNDEAESWYKKVLQIDAKYCGALYNLGLIYQDYKTGSPDDMNKGKDFYNKYIACERTDKEHTDDARRRIKDIDDTFKALEEAKKLEEELKKQMAEMEKMQKQQEEQMKKFQEQQQQQQGGAPPAGGAAAPPAAGGAAPAAGGAAPAPADAKAAEPKK